VIFYHFLLNFFSKRIFDPYNILYKLYSCPWSQFEYCFLPFLAPNDFHSRIYLQYYRHRSSFIPKIYYYISSLYRHRLTLMFCIHTIFPDKREMNFRISNRSSEIDSELRNVISNLTAHLSISKYSSELVREYSLLKCKCLTETDL
jgi:hypothetical protein